MKICDICGTDQICKSGTIRVGRFPKQRYRCSNGHIRTERTPWVEPSPYSHFWRQVEKSTDCWLWTGWTSKGYGSLTHKRKPWTAHRFSWMVHNGPIPEGLWVLHRCDVPLCVNPSHLFLGNAADNSADMTSKGRGRPAIGEDSGLSKLTEEQVLDIRSSPLGPSALSERYGICRQNVWTIRRRLTWTHL